MKKTLGLIKILEENSSPEIGLIKLLRSPELVVKYIYKNVFELIKESRCKKTVTIQQKKVLVTLLNAYNEYYKIIIQDNHLEWVKTILPPYIYGHKNFYMGVAGRLALFSNDLEKEASDIRSGVYSNGFIASFTDAYTLDNIIEGCPDTYYWYGNPRNWADCYEISLDKNKELVIRKSQILILESQYYITKQEFDNCKKTNEDYPETNAPYEIRLMYKGDLSYNYIDNYTIPPINPPGALFSTFYIREKKGIDRMMRKYISNVSLKTGYDPEIQKMWEEYNDIEDRHQRKGFNMNMGKHLPNYRVMEIDEIKDLKEKFIVEYKKKFEKLKEKIDSENQILNERNVKNEYRDLASEYIKKIIESPHIYMVERNLGERIWDY